MNNPVLILVAVLVIVSAALVAWVLLGRRRRGVGFRAYLLNRDIRRQMGDMLAERDREVARLSQQPPDRLVGLLLDSRQYDNAQRAIVSKGPEAVPPLLAALSDPKFRKRSEGGLLGIGGERCERTEPLETVLDCLAEFGPVESVPGLVGLIEDTNREVRRLAALALSSTGADGAVSPLARSLADIKGDVEAVFTSSIYGALRAVEHGRTTAAFREGMYDLIEPLAFDKCAASKDVPQCLLALDRDRAVEYLAAAENLDAKRENLWRVLQALYNAKVTVDEPPLVDLIKSLEASENTYQQKHALEVALKLLARHNTQTAHDTIIRCTQSDSPDLRKAAVQAMAVYQGSDDPRGFLYDRFRNTRGEGLNELQLRVWAVWILIDEVHNGGFSQYFVNSFSDWWRVAATGLEAIGDQSGLVILKEAVAHFGDDEPSPDHDLRHDQLAAVIRHKGHDLFYDLDDRFLADRTEREIKLMQYMIDHAEHFGAG